MSRPPTRDETLLRAIESDLAYYHLQRMAQRQGEQMNALLAERAKVSPDPAILDQLHKAMVQTERDKRDVSTTEREVVEPLRESIRRRASTSGGDQPSEAGTEV